MLLSLVEIEGINVTVANGQESHCKFLCEKFEWKAQGQTFYIDIYTWALESYDLVLKTQ